MLNNTDRIVPGELPFEVPGWIQIIGIDPAVVQMKPHERVAVDLVLTDLVMGEYTGVQILDATLAHHSDASVILMTAHPTVQTAISVLRKGAYDFLVKPFRLEMLKATIKRGLEHQRVIRENLHLRGQVEFLKVAGAANAEVEIDDRPAGPGIQVAVRFRKLEMSAPGNNPVLSDSRQSSSSADVRDSAGRSRDRPGRLQQ